MTDDPTSTAPLPVVRPGGSLADLYAELTETTDADLEPLPTVILHPVRREPEPPYNQQVYRTAQFMGYLLERDRPPEEVVRRSAVMLLSDPMLGGTLLRCNCGGCRRELTTAAGPADWLPEWAAIDRPWADPSPTRVTGWDSSAGHEGLCGRIYYGMDGPPDWAVTGTEHTTCPACTLAAPRHAKAPTRRRRPAAAKARETAAAGRRRKDG